LTFLSNSSNREFVCLSPLKWWVTYLTDQDVGIVRDPTKGLQNLYTVCLYLYTTFVDLIIYRSFVNF
jgi:hypothetical protein